MSHRVHEFSSIARPLEPQYKSNLMLIRLLPVIFLAFAGAAYVFEGAGLLAAAMRGLGAMVTGFLVWALGREMDPDRGAGAYFALALAMAATLYAPQDNGGAAVWTLAFLLMAARVVNRTVGPAAKLTDLGLVLILSAMAVFRDGFAMMGAVAALAFALDALFDRKRTLNLVFALIALSFTVWVLISAEGDFALLIHQRMGEEAVRTPYALMMNWTAIAGGLILAIGAILILALPRPDSRCDVNDEPLSLGRCQGGILIVVLGALFIALTGPYAALTAGGPLLAVLAGAVFGRLWPSKGVEGPQG